MSGDARREFAGVSIDSRTVGAGDLFVAIRGESFDGAEFAGAAIERGAAGVIMPRGRAAGLGGGSAVTIEVDDTTAALQQLARAVRRESGAKVVAITGSAGKTTTKELVAAFLGVRYRVVRNRGNLNNHIGLPLSLMDLRSRPQIAVVELGMNHAGEISTLISIAEPDLRVWTNVGDAHLGFFDSVDAIADAKAEVLERATAETVCVANADDDRIAARLPRFLGRVVTFGVDRAADVEATGVIDRGFEGTTARVVTRGGAFDLSTALIGRGNLANILAATAVALEFDVPLSSIAALAPTLGPAPHRGEVIRLASGVTLIDDSYNANPTATRRAIDVLGGSRTAKRRVAVLGEMLELGEHALALHQGVGRDVSKAGVDLLIAVGGPPAEAIVRAAVDSGMAPERATHVATSDEAADLAARLVAPGDLVLVKGSRGIRTDRVVDRLRAERR
jgi:UDP-N-acetylmuramoyl-tripeptide--D-alanyl-D-alanine ligase